jgi:hypothetical protein
VCFPAGISELDGRVVGHVSLSRSDEGVWPPA